MNQFENLKKFKNRCGFVSTQHSTILTIGGGGGAGTGTVSGDNEVGGLGAITVGIGGTTDMGSTRFSEGLVTDGNCGGNISSTTTTCSTVSGRKGDDSEVGEGITSTSSLSSSAFGGGGTGGAIEGGGNTSTSSLSSKAFSSGDA